MEQRAIASQWNETRKITSTWLSKRGPFSLSLPFISSILPSIDSVPDTAQVNANRPSFILTAYFARYLMEIASGYCRDHVNSKRVSTLSAVLLLQTGTEQPSLCPFFNGKRRKGRGIRDVRSREIRCYKTLEKTSANINSINHRWESTSRVATANIVFWLSRTCHFTS